MTDKAKNSLKNIIKSLKHQIILLNGMGRFEEALEKRKIRKDYKKLYENHKYS